MKLKLLTFVILSIYASCVFARKITFLDCVLGNSRFCDYVGQNTEDIAAYRKNLYETKITRNVSYRLRPEERVLKFQIIGEKPLSNFQTMVGQVIKLESHGFKIDSFNFSDFNFQTIMSRGEDTVIVTADLSYMMEAYYLQDDVIRLRSSVDEMNEDGFTAVGLKIDGHGRKSGLVEIIFEI